MFALDARRDQTKSGIDVDPSAPLDCVPNTDACAALHGAIIQAQASLQAAVIQANATLDAAHVGLISSGILGFAAALVVVAAVIQSGPDRSIIRARRNALRGVVSAQLDHLSSRLWREVVRAHMLLSEERRQGHLAIRPSCPPLPDGLSLAPSEHHGLLGQRFLDAFDKLGYEYRAHQEWCIQNSELRTGERENDPDGQTVAVRNGEMVEIHVSQTTTADAYLKLTTRLHANIRNARTAARSTRSRAWQRLRALSQRVLYKLGLSSSPLID